VCGMPVSEFHIPWLRTDQDVVAGKWEGIALVTALLFQERSHVGDEGEILFKRV